MSGVLRESSYARTFRTVMLGLFVALGVVGFAVSVAIGALGFCLFPVVWTALWSYLFISTVYEVQELGGSTVRLRRPVGSIDVALNDDLVVQEGWSGPGMLYLRQDGRRWRMWGTIGGSVLVQEWFERAHRRGITRS